jgi:hypothetical protein
MYTVTVIDGRANGLPILRHLLIELQRPAGDTVRTQVVPRLLHVTPKLQPYSHVIHLLE